jgi:ubiquinone/menaquinone biosynthesis C-methylase UbiE
MSQEIEYNKYKEKGAYHWKEAERSIFRFNAHQEARFEWILRCLGDVKGKTVLDVGCGDGALTYRIAKKGADVIGIDNSEEGIKLAKEIFNKKKISANFILTDAYKMPIENNSIDCAVLSDVIEHVRKPERLLKEIKRVLKNNGKLVISTPYRFGELLWDKYHTKEYYPSELISLLKPDFKDIEIVESHSALWMFLYTYNSRWTAYQPIFRWLTNILAICFRFNPFLRDNSKRKRFDRFVQITAVAYKYL